MAFVAVISSADISAERWDACVEKHDGLIYSRKEYLDAMCDNWSALVIDEYKAVMAMPWRKKYGLRYIYEPAFIQQLGIIGGEVNEVDVMRAVSEFARYGDLVFNHHNTSLQHKLPLKERTNYVIDLSQGYDAITGAYKKDLVSNLRKANKETLQLISDDDVPSAVSVYKTNYQQRLGNVSDTDFRNFTALCIQLQQKQMCIVRKVLNQSGDVLAIALFLKDNNRIYNIANTTTGKGRNTEANHFLLDGVIREFAGQHLLFDFEGSDIPGVKAFYEKFGAINQPYYHYHHNQLPDLLKLFKR